MSDCKCKSVQPVGNASGSQATKGTKSSGIPWSALIVGGFIGFLGVKALQKSKR